MNITPDLIERFWSKVDKRGPDECWEWVGATHEQGYGKLAVNHKHVKAHRISWTIENGEIPAGLCVLHRCDNPPCVNPEHLFLGTLQDNIRDMYEKGRDVQVRGESHIRAKLTEMDVISIREKRLSGRSWRSLAREFGVSHRQIKRIVDGVAWAHILVQATGGRRDGFEIEEVR